MAGGTCQGRDIIIKVNSTLLVVVLVNGNVERGKAEKNCVKNGVTK